jgi:lipid-binding SYLF domain-containing protein
MLLMSDSAVAYLDKMYGWEIGVGPSVVIVTEGMGRTLTTTTAKDDVYGFIFGQKGLMAGLGLQGDFGFGKGLP